MGKYRLREKDGLDHYQEMASMRGFQDYKIGVFGRETGRIAHFHIWKGSDHPKSAPWRGCIMLSNPDYFKHDGNNDTLNDKGDEAELVEFLKGPRRPGLSRFEYLVVLWNDSNPQWAIPEDTPMPDYTQLP